VFLCLLASGRIFAALPPLVCPAGAPIGAVDLRVVRAPGDTPLPLKTINRLEEGDSVLYRPLLRANEVRKGEVALVLVPINRGPDQDLLEVLEPKPAGRPAQWTVPSRTAVAVFVYGPSGLNRSKVKSYLSKDRDLVTQLADYAEKTAQTEALLQALASNESSGDTVNAAFQGFASQYGYSTQIDHTLPADQQMSSLFRALNPAVASYDPVSPQSSQRVSQGVSAATSVAALFFGSPVGLAAGGTAMLLEMRSMVFPNTTFRSSFEQAIPGGGMGLCGKRDAIPPHTKVAYLWAARISNVARPSLSLEAIAALPDKMKMPLPVKPASETDWKYLDHARDWTLSSGNKTTKVPVAKAGEDTLEVDLTKAHLEPGAYKLSAFWDWDEFSVNGVVTIRNLADFTKAHLTAESQDRLISHTGRVPVALEGTDFEFVTKVELTRVSDKFFVPTPIPFALEPGFRKGMQSRMEAQINTIDLDPGSYQLKFFQPDGKDHDVPITILQVPAKIANLPIILNSGDANCTVTLHGEHLNELAKLESPGIKMTLAPASADGGERRLTLQIDPKLHAGDFVDIKAYLENRSRPLILARAIELANARPSIVESQLSLPNSLAVTLKPGELPAPYYLSALLKVDHLNVNVAVGLRCQGDPQDRVTLHPGTKPESGKLDQLSPQQIFITFDDSLFPSGCELLAQVESDGNSNERPLGRVTLFPQIESVSLDAPEQTVTGSDLETIARVGWDPENSVPISDLPTTIAGEPRKQELRVELPPRPSTNPPLYIWLRGDETGRATSIAAKIRVHAGVASWPAQVDPPRN
jgi:hypothetical protein